MLHLGGTVVPEDVAQERLLIWRIDRRFRCVRTSGSGDGPDHAYCAQRRISTANGLAHNPVPVPKIDPEKFLMEKVTAGGADSTSSVRFGWSNARSNWQHRLMIGRRASYEG